MDIVPVIDIPSKEDVEPIICESDGWVSSHYGHAPYTRLFSVFQEMQAVCSRRTGVGISAVQVGLPLPIFIAMIDKSWRYFLNCEYKPLESASEQISLEGCLSLTKLDGSMRRFHVLRWNKVLVTGQEFSFSNASVTDFAEEFKNFNAVVMQHEIDHQNDILISDIGKEVDVKRVI